MAKTGLSMKKTSIILAFLLTAAVLSAQNSFVRNGSNGSGITANIANGDDGFSEITGSTAFSIGGVLDLGLKFGNIDKTRFDEEATDTEFGLIYNILPIQYNIYMFDLLAAVRGSYEYIIVESDYIDQITGTMEGQGFSIALEGMVDFSPVEFVTVRAGYHIGHTSHIFTVEGDDAGTPVDITARERNNEKGFLAGVWVDYPGIPIVGYEALFLDSDNFGEYIKHRISIVLKSD